MRWYEVITPIQTWNATGDPYALNVEMDMVTSAGHAAVSGSFVKIWGIPLSTILSANQFNNKTISVYGGMQQGLPLATAQVPEEGLLVSGLIFPCVGNWINTDMTLDFYIVAGGGAPIVPKAANVVINWLANTPLAGPLQQALQTAFPAYQVIMRISSQLVLPNDEPGFYQSFHQLSKYVYQISKKIMNNSNYLGVMMAFHGQKILVDDGTQGGPKTWNINPWDLVGQPVWVDLNTVQVKVVMRGDIVIFDHIVLPPTLATLSRLGGAPALSGGITNIYRVTLRLMLFVMWVTLGNQIGLVGYQFIRVKVPNRGAILRIQILGTLIRHIRIFG